MIQLSSTHSGEQLGRELASDPEELSYALISIAGAMKAADAAELADFIRDSGEGPKVHTFLKQLAAALC